MYMSHYTSLHHLIRQIIYEYFSHYLQGALLSTLSARAKSNTCAATKANSDVKSDCRFGSWASRMSADVTVFAAFLAGILSFLSPCVLPLVPPYLIYLAGTSLERLGEAEP